MTTAQKTTLFLLRISLGWLMFYAGITKVLNADWSAAGFLGGAKSFPEVYAWFASDAILPFTNFMNEWGLTLLGVSLLLGLCVRLSSSLGILLMVLYYFPGLEFPVVGHGFLIDDHILYALVLAYFVAVRAGRTWGLDAWISSQKWAKKNKLIQLIS